MEDILIQQIIEKEKDRQQNNIELIASENYTSKGVCEAVGSILTNKYAEGYPKKRYYGGCEFVDEIETVAIERLCKLYGAQHANVQPHCGSSANMAVYMAVLKPGDKVLGMDLSSGGHLTHGHPLSFSGILYEFHSYGVDAKTEVIDYDAVLQQAKKVQPKLIVAGASAYSRIIDFKKLREIADEVNAYLMVDMAHIAGLVAAGLHPSPIEYADFTTTTTHKTLRGPRGGAILCKKEYAPIIDRAVFPGIQGGPLMHIIAGKAVCFYEALQPEFIAYQKQVVKNAKAMEEEFKKEGFRIVSSQTDNHLLLVDVKSGCGLTGKESEKILDQVCITCNKNSIPFDTEKPFTTSGIRIGTPAMTTRGFKEEEFRQVARWISKVLKNHEDIETLETVKEEVLNLTRKFTVEI